MFTVIDDQVDVKYFSEFVGLVCVTLDRKDTSPSSTYMALQRRIKKKAVTKTVEWLALKELQLKLDDVKIRFRREVLK